MRPSTAERRWVSFCVLAVRHPRHLAVLVAEDLLRVVAVADGAAVERALDAIVSVGLCASSLVSRLLTERRCGSSS